MKYCLIGERLSHSFSKVIHESCGLSYDLVELAPCELEGFVKNCPYDGFNVTIPYKKAVMAYLDEIDEGAKAVGAVNTVKVVDGRTVGYNTDVIGLREMIEASGVNMQGKSVLVLGSGGASSSAQAVARASGARSVTMVSRTGEVNYDNVHTLSSDAEIIINATPVGMFPHVNESPVSLAGFGKLAAVFDCVYNPIRTTLVLDALRQGVVARGGLAMLVGQAVAAQKIWGVYNAKKAENTAKSLTSQKNNLVLSGMAGCGKSTIGRRAAEALNMPFVDVDEEIAKTEGASPEQIILKCGEPYFRQVESRVIAELAKTGGRVIALGGGAVLRQENVHALKQNGVIVYIERDVDLLETKGRPLSVANGARALFEGRRPVYEGTADARVQNDSDLTQVTQEVVRVYEDISYQRS